LNLKVNFSLVPKQRLDILFTPRKGATFEQIEGLTKHLNQVIQKGHFNIHFY